MVLVGATIVGSMATTGTGWSIRGTGAIAGMEYADRPFVLEQGEEMGRFLLGSTVIMLFEKDVIVDCKRTGAPKGRSGWREAMATALQQVDPGPGPAI